MLKNTVLPFDLFLTDLREHEIEYLATAPVMVICDHADCASELARVVRKRGLEAICASDLAEARPILDSRRFSLIFANDTLPDADLKAVLQVAGEVPVVVFSRAAEWDSYLAAINRGAFDYIACPLDEDDADRSMRNAFRELAARRRPRTRCA